MQYPESFRSDHVDICHGEPIADPYRWLEDPDSAETVSWVGRQREFADAVMEKIPSRAWFTERLAAELSQPNTSTVYPASGWFWVLRSDGKQDQPCLYVARSPEELAAAKTPLVDPNTWDGAPTSSISGVTISPDGSYLSYVRSDAGSDWQTIHVHELATGQELDEPERVTKFCLPLWLPDSSYLYLTYQNAGQADGTETQVLPKPIITRHALGATDDDQVFVPEGDGFLGVDMKLSDDQRYVVVSITVGTESQMRVLLLDAADLAREPVWLAKEYEHEYYLVGNRGNELLFLTDHEAPLKRIVATSGAPLVEATEVIGESEYLLEDAWVAGGYLLAAYLRDAQPAFSRFSLQGEALGELPLSGGAAVGVGASAREPKAFVGISDPVCPNVVWEVDMASGQVASWAGNPERQATPEIVIRRARATSTDGARVPYFIIAAKTTDLTRPQPVLQYGYGGFQIPVLADYRAGWAGWLAAGGVLVIANLRGGGEFGVDWYNQGRKANKQRVFDDFIAVSEHLIETGVTTTSQLAIHGRSNGGLLVGACMTQRPELYACALPQVGVLDVLRFHKFTVGAAWASDFGNPDVAEDFEVARRYSPLHNLVPGTNYPATMVLTGDHDDRVVPAHSYKFAAELQRCQTGSAPTIIRIEVATGHGAGKPKSMVASEWADLLAFAAHYTGLANSGLVE